MQQTFGQNNCWSRDLIDFCTFMVARATYNKCTIYVSSSATELTRFHHQFYLYSNWKSICIPRDGLYIFHTPANLMRSSCFLLVLVLLQQNMTQLYILAAMQISLYRRHSGNSKTGVYRSLQWRHNLYITHCHYNSLSIFYNRNDLQQTRR